MAAFMEVVNPDVTTRFTNAQDSDFVICPASNTQSIVIGASNNPSTTRAAFKLTSSNLEVNSNLVFGGGLVTKGMCITQNTPGAYNTMSNPASISGITSTGFPSYSLTLSNTQTSFQLKDTTGSNIFSLGSNATINTNMITIQTGSNAQTLSNIVDSTGTWTTLNDTGTIVVTNSSPKSTATSNGSIDMMRGYYTFSNNTLTANSNIAHSNILSTSFYVDTWVYYYSVPPLVSPNESHLGFLVGNASPTAAASKFWTFGVNRNFQLSFFTAPGGGAVRPAVFTQSNTITPHTWTHIAMSYCNTTSNLTFYVNGVAQSNLTACNVNTSNWFTVANASATSATLNVNSNLGAGFGSLTLGQISGSNNPCYIHDFRMVTGTTYAPSNPPQLPAANISGTRFIVRAEPRVTSSNQILTTIDNGYLGITNSNPSTELEVSGGCIKAGAMPFQMHMKTGTLPGSNLSATITYPAGLTRENIVDVWGLTQYGSIYWAPWDYDSPDWVVSYYLEDTGLFIQFIGSFAASRPYKVWFLTTQ
jgi:hypothetical protein